MSRDRVEASSSPFAGTTSRGVGRRAVWRWAWRMVRRDRLSTLLITVLLAVPVAATTYAVVAMSSTARPPGATMGAADALIGITAGEADEKIAVSDALVARFPGSIAVTAADLLLPGRAERNEVIAIDATHPTAAGYVTLLSGSAPTGGDDVAISPALARRAHLAAGGALEVEGRLRTVVGIVENPGLTGQSFAVVAPWTLAEPSVWSVFALAPAISKGGIDASGAPSGGSDPPATVSARRGEYVDGTLSSIIVSLFGLLALAEVALVAGAAFAVSARRRQRDLALIASAGATPRQLRSAVVGGALVLGVIGAAVGAAVGLVAAQMSTGWFERAGHRMLTAAVIPWWFVVAIAGAALGAAALAGWWPARAVARQSVVEALAARRPEVTGAGRSATAAVACVGVGTAVSVAAFRAEQNELVAVSTVVATVGVVLLAPTAVGLIGRLGPHLPTSARVAARDLSRNRGRTAAGVAALIVALAFPLTVGFATASFDRLNRETFIERTPRSMALVVPIGSDYLPTGFDADRYDTAAALARAFPDAAIAPWVVPVNTNSSAYGVPGDWIGRGLVSLTKLPDGGHIDLPFTIATPEVLAALDDPVLAAAIASHRVVTTDRRVQAGASVQMLRVFQSSVVAPGTSPPVETSFPVHVVEGETYSAAPTSFISADLARQVGWQITVNGWIVAASHDLAVDELDRIAEIAAVSGFRMIETGRPSSERTASRIVTLIGGVNAVAIVAIIVALTRAEVRNDDRLLASLGARPRSRRARAAATAGLTTLVGAVLAVPASAIPLAGLLSQRQYDWVPPVETLLVVLVVVPCVAMASTWMATRSQRDVEPLAGVG